MALRKRGGHTQLPPHYICIDCRTHQCGDCIDFIVPSVRNGHRPRMCSCEHRYGQPPTTPRGPAVAPAGETVFRPAGLVSYRGRAHARKVKKNDKDS